jgi:hypothetical protein
MPILTIEIMGYVGVAFWLSMIVQSALASDGSLGAVALVGIVLGGAHIVISFGARRRSRIAYLAMWFVLVGDTLLALFVDARAWALVVFTIVLLLLTRTRPAREWWAERISPS